MKKLIAVLLFILPAIGLQAQETEIIKEHSKVLEVTVENELDFKNVLHHGFDDDEIRLLMADSVISKQRRTALSPIVRLFPVPEVKPELEIASFKAVDGVVQKTTETKPLPVERNWWLAFFLCGIPLISIPLLALRSVTSTWWGSRPDFLKVSGWLIFSIFAVITSGLLYRFLEWGSFLFFALGLVLLVLSAIKVFALLDPADSISGWAAIYWLFPAILIWLRAIETEQSLAVLAQYLLLLVCIQIMSLGFREVVAWRQQKKNTRTADR